jgi:hypothetical protein
MKCPVRAYAWAGWGVGGSMFVVREISVPVGSRFLGKSQRTCFMRACVHDDGWADGGPMTVDKLPLSIWGQVVGLPFTKFH